jgi:hypothetical protein
MHYSFEIAENMAGNEGSVEGYFAVQQEIAGLGMAIVDCQISLEDVNPEANIIPVILDEFGSDLMLSRILAQPYDVTRLASIASFGFDRDHQNYRIAHSSHFAIICRETGKLRPSFLAPLLTPPTTEPLKVWSDKTELRSIHLRFGELSVKGNTCVIQIDDSVEPVPSYMESVS